MAAPHAFPLQGPRPLERDMVNLRKELEKFKQEVQEELVFIKCKQMHQMLQLQQAAQPSIQAPLFNIGQNQSGPVQEASDSKQQERKFSTGQLRDKYENASAMHDEPSKFTEIREEIHRIWEKFSCMQVQQAPDAFKLREETNLVLQEFGFAQVKDEIGKIRDELDKMKVQEAPSPHEFREQSQLSLQEEKQEQDIDRTRDADANVGASHTLNTPQELDDHIDHTYTLKGSMWDAVMLVGMQHLGLGTSVLLGLVLLINVIVQVVFCSICWMAFTESHFDAESIFGLKVWRWYSAHDASHVNQLWPMSLASRVCEDDASLILSGQQTELSNLIKDYRPQEAPFVGQLMCLLCLLCFWTRLWSETKNTIRFMRAAITVSGKHTILYATPEGIQLISISPFRKAWVAMFFALRIFILVNLAVVVTVWLSHTTSLSELLLNALALELVLNVDELLFEGLAPARAMAFLENLLPLPVWYRKCNGVDLESMLGISIMLAVIPGVYFSLLEQTLGFVDEADTALCGGVTNFAYNVDQLGIVYIHDQMMTPSAEAVRKEGFDQSDPRIQAINDVIDGIPREEWQYAIHEQDLASLKAKSVNEPSILKDELNRECTDLLALGVSTNNALSILAALRGATGNMSFDICSKQNIEPYCYQSSLKADRVTHLALLLCPVSCGCTSVNSGTLVYSGCPSTCINHLQTNLEALNPCQDIDWKRSTSWSKWMQEAELFVPGHIMASLKVDGCKGLQNHPARNSLCEGSSEWSGLKPLSGVCPESCGCRTQLEGAPQNCPDSCSSMLCPKPVCDRGLPGKNFDANGNLCTCEKDIGSCYQKECMEQYVEGGCKATRGCVWDPMAMGRCNCACGANTFAWQSCTCGTNTCFNVPHHCYNEADEEAQDGNYCSPTCVGTPAKPLAAEFGCRCALSGTNCGATKIDNGCSDDISCLFLLCNASNVDAIVHCSCGTNNCRIKGGCYNTDGEQDHGGDQCYPPCVGSPEKPIDRTCTCDSPPYPCNVDAGCDPRHGRCDEPMCSSSKSFPMCKCGSTSCGTVHGGRCYNDDGEQDDSGSNCHVPCNGTVDNPIERVCQCGSALCRLDFGCGQQDQNSCQLPACGPSNVLKNDWCKCGSHICHILDGGCCN